MEERGIPKGARSLATLLLEREQWKQAVGSAFADTRAASGQTQSEFADVLGISQPYLSQIENGSRTPSEETLRKLQTFTEGARSGDSNE